MPMSAAHSCVGTSVSVSGGRSASSSPLGLVGVFVPPSPPHAARKSGIDRCRKMPPRQASTRTLEDPPAAQICSRRVDDGLLRSYLINKSTKELNHGEAGLQGSP